MEITENDYPLVAEYKEDEMHISVKKTINKVFIYRDKQVFSFDIPPTRSNREQKNTPSEDSV